MSHDPEYSAARRIVKSIRTSFPAEAERIDRDLERDYYEDAPYAWLERFSQLTSDAIGREEFSAAASHMNHISRILAAGDESTLRCIDVAYVESLMWDVKDENIKREGWKLIPENLRRLYIDMWGERPFMQSANEA